MDTTIAKSLISFVALGLALTFGQPAFGQSGTGGTTPTTVAPLTLTLEAEGHVRVAPDMAILTLGVEHRAKTARAAMDQLNADLAAILARLTEQGIAERDVQTTGLALNPLQNYDSGRKLKSEGFEARSQVTVRVRDLDRLGPLMDTAVSDGANLFQGLTFTVADPAPLRDQARAAAVAEVLRLGTLYAAAAGTALPPLTALSEIATGRPMPMARASLAMEDAGGVPVAAGEVTITVRVAATFGGSD